MLYALHLDENLLNVLLLHGFMKAKYFVLVMLLAIGLTASSQQKGMAKPTYKTAIGVRALPFGISFKSNIDYTKRSFEIIGYFKDGFTGSFLYYWNFDLSSARNLKLYGGGGAQLGYMTVNDGGSAQFGVGAVIGADYKFLHLPLNVSIDWQPGIRFGNESEFKGYGGIAARFTL
jgi:hypothetical protein